MKLQAPEGAENTTVGIAGNEYQVNKNGVVDVPDDLAPALYPHGFKQVSKVKQSAADPSAGAGLSTAGGDEKAAS